MSRNELKIDREISTNHLKKFQSRSNELIQDALEETYIGDKSDEFLRGLVSGYYTAYQLAEQGESRFILQILCFLSKRVKK